MIEYSHAPSLLERFSRWRNRNRFNPPKVEKHVLGPWEGIDQDVREEELWKAYNMLGVLFPHCDHRVLHEPGKCEICDMPEYKTWQALRLAWDIAFTDNEPRAGQLPCPAMYARGSKSLNSWHGNQPYKE